MKINGINRYGHTIEVEQSAEFLWEISCPESIMSRSGWDGDKQTFWDPEGGPFIGLDLNLNKIHAGLPNAKIVAMTTRLGGGIVATVHYNHE